MSNNWWEIIERIRAEHNGVMSVELFMGHNGHYACLFRDYDKALAGGDSGRSMQEAVENCIQGWHEFKKQRDE